MGLGQVKLMPGGEVEHSFRLFPGEAIEHLHDFVNGEPVFEIFEDGGHRDARPAKNPGATDFTRYAFDRRAL